MNEREEEDAREAQLFDALTKCEMKDSRKRQKENDRRDTFVMLEAQKANLNQKKKTALETATLKFAWMWKGCNPNMICFYSII